MLSKVLMVDDDPGIRLIAGISLQEVGKLDARIIESGRKALAMAAEFHPDVILLDVMMPGLDGLKTFELLKKLPQFVKTPIIFVTAKVQKHEMQAYYDLGAAGVVLKPFDPMSLPQQIESICREWQGASAGED